MNRDRKLPLLAAVFIALLPVSGRSDPARCPEPKATLLTSGLQGPFGITVGPDRALYVAESATGRISRIDPNTGATTVFASGLPKRLTGLTFGGPVDVAFVGNTAYVLVSLVSPDLGGNSIDGIYRVDGPNTFTVVANIGAWSIAHPPKTGGEVPSGVHWALHTYRDGFLVSDANHNRVLFVTLDHCANFDSTNTSNISEFITFLVDNTPSGLAVSGDDVYVAEAGADPHLPQDGKVVAFDPDSGDLDTVASGAPFLLDVKFRRGDLYALSNGVWTCCGPGDPALPNTGSLVKVNDDGGFTVITDHLDRPVSLQFIGNTAYFVSLAGEVWKIEDVSCRRGHDPR
ncbi:MAG TPA: ScyD/ScyE family protein [Bryobacteraceae bacterium]|jgi:sugar lactone lactonase YvrE|nr:ScyD/ScyE family protein [Bryobacteraceae bacterium]